MYTMPYELFRASTFLGYQICHQEQHCLWPCFFFFFHWSPLFCMFATLDMDLFTYTNVDLKDDEWVGNFVQIFFLIGGF